SLNSGAVKVSPHDAYQPATTLEAPAPSVEIVSEPKRKAPARKPAASTAEIVSKPRAAKAAEGDLSVPAKPARKRAAKPSTKSDIVS
ncbi:MAG TPA: twin-arginine translocase subunit TatB, partial [Caulobacter sp.]|nr:twin-arginine translocase subunit TatB [Caulobacter sp.]